MLLKDADLHLEALDLLHELIDQADDLAPHVREEAFGALDANQLTPRELAVEHREAEPRDLLETRDELLTHRRDHAAVGAVDDRPLAAELEEPGEVLQQAGGHFRRNLLLDLPDELVERAQHLLAQLLVLHGVLPLCGFH